MSSSKSGWMFSLNPSPLFAGVKAIDMMSGCKCYFEIPLLLYYRLLVPLVCVPYRVLVFSADLPLTAC